MKVSTSKFILYFLCIAMFVSCKLPNKQATDALQIAESNSHLLESTGQVLLVYNENRNDYQSTLVLVEKNKGTWKIVMEPIAAGIGRNGFAEPNKKVEGDGKSPTGIFRLGHLFAYNETVKTKMPFSQSTFDDKWIDDPESDDYNRHVHGKTNAKSYENLRLKSDFYKYCMVIEYNTNPVVKGKGSAIFFHLSESPPGSTAGCVSITEENMLQVLKWLNPDLNPKIIMGNKEDLLSGLTNDISE